MMIEDPEPYQAFFTSLSKALFLEAHLVDDKKAGGGKKTTPVAKTTAAKKTAPQSATIPTAKPIGAPQKAPDVASVPLKEPVVRLGLRRKPVEISNHSQITAMLKEYNFYDRVRNPRGGFKNALIENKNDTVTDDATGLMWQKSGSTGNLDRKGAKKYIKELNRQGFAGYSDWRMPTVEELASLLSRKKTNGVHLAPEFDNKNSRCWTADECDTQNYLTLGAWIVNFKHGQIQQGWYKKPSVTANFGITALRKDHNYVKAVRTIW